MFYYSVYCSIVITNQIIVSFCSYVRAEVVAAFVNALFLLFIAFFIFAEAIEVSVQCNHITFEVQTMTFIDSIYCNFLSVKQTGTEILNLM